MATIKVFSPDGVKELNCFDTIDNVPFFNPETGFEEDEFELGGFIAEE